MDGVCSVGWLDKSTHRTMVHMNLRVHIDSQLKAVEQLRNKIVPTTDELMGVKLALGRALEALQEAKALSPPPPPSLVEIVSGEAWMIRNARGEPALIVAKYDSAVCLKHLMEDAAEKEAGVPLQIGEEHRMDGFVMMNCWIEPRDVGAAE